MYAYTYNVNFLLKNLQTIIFFVFYTYKYYKPKHIARPVLCSRRYDFVITAIFPLAWPESQVNFNDFDTNMWPAAGVRRWRAMEGDL